MQLLTRPVYLGFPTGISHLLGEQGYVTAAAAAMDRMSAERLQAERLALSTDPMVRLQMASLSASAATSAASTHAHTHTHAHAHTHLHVHQQDPLATPVHPYAAANSASQHLFQAICQGKPATMLSGPSPPPAVAHSY